MNQVDFGAKIGITGGSVSLLESGKNNPSEQTIRLICREFGVNYLWLTTGDDPMYVPKEAIGRAAMERILDGQNEYVKSVFFALADMPAEWWEQAVEMLKSVFGKEKDRR